MTFLHSGLLAALALTAVPVLLHLLLRQKPKRIDFPALRLVQSRTKRSTKRLRLRHLSLLALRVLLIAGMVFAAARPLLPAADWSFRWWDGLILGALCATGYSAQRWWTKRAAQHPGRAMQEQAAKRGSWGIWSVFAIVLLLVIGLPYASRVRASMREAPTAEDLNLPIAGVVVFDVSASMSYQEAGQTLLDVGRQIVADHVGAMPEGSRISITDTATDQPLLFQVSLTSVPTQLERLVPQANARSLNGAVAAAFDAHRQDRERIQSEGGDRDRYVRRIYVVTDLAKTAWQFPDPFELEATASAEESPGLFVLDVGAETPRNRGVGELSLSSDELPRGGMLAIRSRFQSSIDESTTAELLIGEGDEAAKVAAQELNSDGESLAFLPSMSFDAKAVGGTVRLTGSDPLAIDDARYFSVGVTPLPNVLLVSDSDDDVFALRLMLEGDKGVQVPSRYQLTVIKPSELADRTLGGQDVVCLVNVPRLDDRQWGEVATFVRNGGGLAVFMGSDEIQSFSYNRGAAREVLPALPDVWGSRPEDDPARLVFVKSDGPFVDRIAPYEGARETLEEAVRVRRFWRVTPEPDATVIARLTADHLPALVSRSVGKGLSIMLITDVSIRKRREEWTNLMQPDNGNYWASVLFFDQLMRHLARVGSERRNFTAGEIPTMTLPDAISEDRLLLRTPDLRNLPVERSSENQLVLPMADVPGHYSVVTAGGELVGRFSVNHRSEESDLTQATREDLASVFGEDSFELATSLEELNEEIDVARFGQEAFPMLVLLAVLFFAGETLLSSRFYGEAPNRPATRTGFEPSAGAPSSDPSPTTTV